MIDNARTYMARQESYNLTFHESFYVIAFLVTIIVPVLLVVLLWLIAAVFSRAKKQRDARDRQKRDSLRAEHKEQRKRWDQIVAGLLQNPTDVNLLQTALSFIKAHKAFRDCGYDMALDLVAASDAAKPNKVFALQVGRLRYSQHREDGVPTVYDEAAIENDIKARC